MFDVKNITSDALCTVYMKKYLETFSCRLFLNLNENLVEFGSGKVTKVLLLVISQPLDTFYWRVNHFGSVSFR